jgi:hypothetical protein
VQLCIYCAIVYSYHDIISLSQVAIAKTCMELGYNVTLITEICNESIIRAAVDGIETRVYMPNRMHRDLPPMLQFDTHSTMKFCFVESPSLSSENESELKGLMDKTDLIIACGRPGPSSDGNCYTMSGINMNENGLIAPLHNFISGTKGKGYGNQRKFIAIGDGGNELGMGKVIDKIHEHIKDGEKIGAVATLDDKDLSADHLIAASVSNWGAYALIAAAVLVRASDSKDRNWIKHCLPTEEAETKLLHRCVEAGCRDGVSGENEATVDGMPLERSMECLREIRKIARG